MASESTLIAAVRAANKQLTDALAAYDAANAAPATTAGYKVVLIGDSRLAGTNPNAKIDWGGVLGGRTDILNLAVAGSKTTDWINGNASLGIDPWYKTVAKIVASGAKKVIIQLGKNDIDAGTSAVNIAHNMQDLVFLIGYWSAQAAYNGNAIGGSAATQVKVGVLGPLPVGSSVQNAAYINSINDQLQNEIPLGAYGIGKITPAGTWYQGFQNMVSNGVLLDQYAVDGVHFSQAGITAYAPSIATLESMIPS